jgi:hypothetical protein
MKRDVILTLNKALHSTLNTTKITNEHLNTAEIFNL